LVAAEVSKIMKAAGVSLASDIDFAEVGRLDTLIADPPETLSGDLHIVGWLNAHIDMIEALLRHRPRTAKSP
jgi:hypothetical protein